MCAWKRGTQNNLPGVIRKGHIKEFLVQQTAKEGNISAFLKSLEAEKLSDKSAERFINCANAYVCTSANGLPESFLPFVVDNVLYLHAHEYPKCIVTAVLSVDVPYGCIVLNETHRVNSKVCTGDVQSWTVYQGEQFMYDCREGAIGDTEVRITGKPPPTLRSLVLEVKPYSDDISSVSDEGVFNIDCPNVISQFTKSLLHCIVTVDEIHVVSVSGIQYVGRVHEVYPEVIDDDDEHGGNDLDCVIHDDYRGLVDEFTEVFLLPDKTLPLLLDDGSSCVTIFNTTKRMYQFHNNPPIPSKSALSDIVNIHTSDSEVFPVKRKLLRPCLALTGVVQAGKGKYKLCNDNNDGSASQHCEKTGREDGDGNYVVSANVDVDACTFDRVLLYLEHAARGEQFRFDPLLANELLDAAIVLKIVGLQDTCNKVLGSFQERVRTTPIRLEEVYRRNLAGSAPAVDEKVGSSTSSHRKRSETLLLMSGMVFDITRWLDEHPGGSTIIPEQALNVDCTLFFEIYHASRQSFLYLKEFYIGELSLEDRDRVPLPKGYATQMRKDSGSDSTNDGKASDAFIDQLNRITGGWRQDVTKMNAYEMYKSF